MKKTVKLLACITICCALNITTFAQLRMPSINGIAGDIKKVIDDYPNRFVNLMGEVINQSTQSTDYRSVVQVNGADESFVTRYSAKKEVCSFQATMLTTENFEKAKSKYRALFNQLNNLNVNPAKGVTCKLKGKFEAPDESSKFTSVIFELSPANEAVSKLRIEISMQYQAPMDWVVKVLVYDRERNDDERGETRDGE